MHSETCISSKWIHARRIDQLKCYTNLGAIHVLHNAVGVRVYRSVHISVTKVHVPTLLVLRGDVCPISRKKTLRNTWMATNFANTRPHMPQIYISTHKHKQ